MPGRNPKPLMILCHPDLQGYPQIQELVTKGHTVQWGNEDWASLADYDLVLGWNCWRMSSDLLKYLPEAVKGARAAKYGVRKEVPGADHE